MKIVSIKFKNLNSLKGVHEIRFNQPPFTDSGLFAITGPTGAGKTTILDAITVALYARVHRHNKDVFEIMTRHTGESYSEVEFEVKEKIYRAKWSMWRSRGKADGKLQLQKMELADALTGAIIAEHPLPQVQQAIVDISGLDYNQFLRSVMLSQGDFTRFLKADENERSELLEKITDTGIYSDISTFTFEKTKLEKDKLAALQARLNDVPLLSDEERLACQASLAETTAKENLEKAEKKKLDLQLAQLHHIERLHHRKQELQQAYEDFSVACQAMQPAFEKLRLHQQALKHQPLLAEMGSAGSWNAEITERLSGIAVQLPGLEQAVAALTRQMHEAESAYATAEALQKEAAPVIAEVEKMDVLMAHEQPLYAAAQREYADAHTLLEKMKQQAAIRQNNLKQLQHNTALLQQWLQEHQLESELEKTISLISHYLERLEEINQKINTDIIEKQQYEQQENTANESMQQLQQEAGESRKLMEGWKAQLHQHNERLLQVLSGKTLQDWEARADVFPQIISLCHQQLNNALRISRCDNTIAELALKAKTWSEQSAGESASCQLQEREYQQAQEHLVALQKNVELQMLIQKYEADRQTLLPGEACPLCGSTHHPFAENHPIRERSEAIQKRDAQQQKVAVMLKKLNDTEVLVRSLNNNIEQAGRQMQPAMMERSAVEKQFAQVNESLPNPLRINQPSVIEAVIAGRKNEQEALKRTIGDIRDIERQVKDADTRVRNLQDAILVNESNLQQTLHQTEHAKTTLERLTTAVEANKSVKGEINGKMVQLLDPYYISYNDATGKAIPHQLQQRRELYLLKQKTLQQMMLALTQAESDVNHAGSTITEKEESLRQQAERLAQSEGKLAALNAARFALFGKKDTWQERESLQTRLTESKNRIELLRNERHKSQQSLEIARNLELDWAKEKQKAIARYDELAERLALQLQTDHIPSVDILKQHFLTRTDAERIEQQQRDAEEERIRLQYALQETEKSLQHETANLLTAETVETVTEAVAALEVSMSRLNQAMGRIMEIVKADEARKKQYSALALSIALQQNETGRWSKLSLLIGSADGKKFSRFAQGLTLARLTGLANRHLLRLSDRYRILKSAEKDLELQIIDGYQADVVRPMATLSGGESFLVSLALALGLSDLASRKVQINSLFIDEGFGTLDAETLDIAISALENLQANGKTIGVISHVDALKERIGTQIQVSKQPGGSSTIRLVSYASEIPGR